jgi:pimeloyl-ACP methyl ester carboxylesterase
MHQTEPMTIALRLVRSINGLLSTLAPSLAGRVAVRMFTSPRRHRPPEREREAERRGERMLVRTAHGDLSALRFGRGRGPRVLAIHGWEGRATQWGPLAELLEQAGFELVAIDAPAHGHSPGRRAHVAAFAEALLFADDQLGPFAAVVGHSMGAAAATIALNRGLRARRAVLIAGPARLDVIVRQFARHLGLSDDAKQAFERRLEGIVGHPAQELGSTELAGTLRHPALIIHSRDDRVVPFSNAEAIARAWPNGHLLAVDGVGHRRILRSESVLEAVRAAVLHDRRLARPNRAA